MEQGSLEDPSEAQKPVLGAHFLGSHDGPVLPPHSPPPTPDPEHPEAMCQWGTALVPGLSSGGTWFLSVLAARSPVFLFVCLEKLVIKFYFH